MQIPRDAILLRIFFGEDDKFGRLPLHEAKNVVFAVLKDLNLLAAAKASMTRSSIGTFLAQEIAPRLPPRERHLLAIKRHKFSRGK